MSRVIITTISIIRLITGERGTHVHPPAGDVHATCSRPASTNVGMLTGGADDDDILVDDVLDDGSNGGIPSPLSQRLSLAVIDRAAHHSRVSLSRTTTLSSEPSLVRLTISGSLSANAEGSSSPSRSTRRPESACSVGEGSQMAEPSTPVREPSTPSRAISSLLGMTKRVAGTIKDASLRRGRATPRRKRVCWADMHGGKLADAEPEPRNEAFRLHLEQETQERIAWRQQLAMEREEQRLALVGAMANSDETRPTNLSPLAAQQPRPKGGVLRRALATLGLGRAHAAADEAPTIVRVSSPGPPSPPVVRKGSPRLGKGGSTGGSSRRSSSTSAASSMASSRRTSCKSPCKSSTGCKQHQTTQGGSGRRSSNQGGGGASVRQSGRSNVRDVVADDL